MDRYCPSCFAEFVEGTQRCSDCGVELLPKGEDSEVTPGISPYDETRFVLIATADDAFEAEDLTHFLAGEGVPVLTSTRRGSSVETLTLSVQRPWWEVRVPEPLRDRAAKLVQDHRAESRQHEAEAVRAAEKEAVASPDTDPAGDGGEGSSAAS